MFVDCYLVFRQRMVTHRSKGGRRERRVEQQPLYVCRDEEAAKRFSAAVEEETGMPSPVSRLRLWEEAPHAQG